MSVALCLFHVNSNCTVLAYCRHHTLIDQLEGALTPCPGGLDAAVFCESDGATCATEGVVEFKHSLGGGDDGDDGVDPRVSMCDPYDEV